MTNERPMTPYWRPAIRISVGLILIMVSVFLIADVIGLVPNEYEATLNSRKKISEALAIQFSILASHRDERKIGLTLEKIVDRNSDILSAALRDRFGRLAFQAGDHSTHWTLSNSDHSTPNQVVVPIFRANGKWGSVEIAFEPISNLASIGFRSHSTILLIGFVGILSFLGFLFVIHRTLRELDPSSVIPERVNAAFNTLEEGVLILDEAEQIVLANTAFADNLERSPRSLLGRTASELPWASGSRDTQGDRFPWLETLDRGESRLGRSLELRLPHGKTKIFTVNSAPIRDSKNKPRGVLVTFDDVSEIVEKNDQLHQMVSKLEISQAEVQRQNEVLHDLATKDSLTGCLNRRAFNERFEVAFRQAEQSGQELSCLMTDIDHFKSVNDNFGHGVGDEVIKLLADVLRSHAGDLDFVGRYGGEEFCEVFPGRTINETAEIAERIRVAVNDSSRKKFPEGPHVTISVGVASLQYRAASPGELNTQADMALYEAKKGGRNRVVKWGSDGLAQSGQDPSIDQEDNSLGHLDRKAGQATGGQSGFAEQEVNRLQVRVKQLENIAQQYSRELQHKSSYDALTGLANEMLFFDRIKQALARAQRANQTVAIFALDIDLFGRVNNVFGRDAGDRLLKEVADRLTRILRESDTVSLSREVGKDVTVCRLCGDEFGILLADLNDMRPVTWIIKRIFESLETPIVIDQQPIVVTCKIGVSLYPDDGQSPEELLNHAGAARQYAKQLKGQNSYRMFDVEMHQVSLRQMQLEGELRRAIENEEFVLHYQPKFEMASSSIRGVEALIRWNHPQRGLLLPAEFMSVAEQSGLIVQIGEWVLRQACLQTKNWLGMGLKELRVAVNLSSVQLRQKTFLERVLHIVKEAEIPPRFLELEITETVIMDNLETAAQIMNRLHRKGFWISLDDFGTGYSSLNYLKHFPLDTLKIDRSFLQDIQANHYDRTIVKTIIAMAHSMKLKVTAEGVETPEQLAILRRYSCDEIQGHLFSQPVSASEVTERLRKRPVWMVQAAG